MSSTSWEYTEIGKAVKAGYISGYEDNTIRPSNKISRQEAAIIISNLLKLDTAKTPVSALDKFTDASKIAAWSKSAVAAIASKGFMDGYQDYTYRPDAFITRAEAVVSISRAFDGKGTTAVKT